MFVLTFEIKLFWILKIGDLDLAIQGQIGLQTSKIFVLTFEIELFYLPTLTFIEHLNLTDGLRTGDLDLDR